MKTEIEKIDRLSDYGYLSKNILQRAVRISHERKLITDVEEKVLLKVVEKQIAQSADLEEVLTVKHKSDISRIIAKLRKKKMLAPVQEGKRKYLLRFDNNYLLRGIMQALDENGFLPIRN